MRPPRPLLVLATALVLTAACGSDPARGNDHPDAVGTADIAGQPPEGFEVPRPNDALHWEMESWIDDPELIDDRCSVEVCWKNIYGLPQTVAILNGGVYNPHDYYALTRKLTAHNIVKGRAVLDMGTGTGALALVAGHFGAAKIVGTDINPRAVANATQNAARFGFSDRFEVRQVSLENPGAYAVIGADERFDLIVSNPPNNDVQPANLDEYDEADPGFQFLESIIRGLPDHLTPTGRLWLHYSAPHGLRRLQKLVAELGWSATIYATEFEEDFATHEVRPTFHHYGPITPIVEIRPPSATDAADTRHAAPPGAGNPRQPDSADYLLGPVLKGRAVAGNGLTALAGVAVTELGVEEPQTVTSDADGWWKLTLRNEEVVTVLVTHPGFMDTIQIATAASRPYFEGEYWIELFPALDPRDAGAPPEWNQEPAHGGVILNFQPYGSAAGVTARLDAPAPATAWVFDAADRMTAGNSFGVDPFAGEVEYRNVAPGSYPVTIEPPAGIACPGPATVPVIAGTSTRAYYFCQASP